MGKKKLQAFGPVDVEVVSAEDLPNGRIRLMIKLSGGEHYTVVWDDKKDAIAALSVARAAGAPVERVPAGYAFETRYLVGVKVSGCAIAKGKRRGRVHLFHPDEVQKMRETGKLATEAIL